MARNPSAIPADTSREVWRIQMAAIARRGVDERIAEWEALNREVAVMEADGVRRRHPGFLRAGGVLRVGSSTLR